MKTTPIAIPPNWQNLQPHPLSALVEFGAGIDVAALAEHMRNHGYDEDEAIIVHDGMILDGRHKHRAAIAAGVIPTFKRFVGRNAMAYVAKKLFRQHLDTSQRAMMAATLTKLSPLAGVQNCTPATLAEAAETMNVSRRSVANATKVQNTGTASLNEAVRDGTLTVGDAAAVADKPAEVQDQAVEAVRSGIAGTVAEATGANTNRPAGKQPRSILCSKCTRLGPSRDCPICKALRADATRREPGDDTESIEADKQKEKTSPKPGAVVWYPKVYEKTCAEPLKLLYHLFKNLGLMDAQGAVKETPELVGIRRRLEEIRKDGLDLAKAVLKKPNE